MQSKQYLKGELKKFYDRHEVLFIQSAEKNLKNNKQAENTEFQFVERVVKEKWFEQNTLLYVVDEYEENSRRSWETINYFVVEVRSTRKIIKEVTTQASKAR